MTKTQSSQQQRAGEDTDPYSMWMSFYQRMAEDGMSFFAQGLEAAQKMSPMYAGQEVFQAWLDNYQGFVKSMMPDVTGSNPHQGAYQQMYGSWMDNWTQSLERMMSSPEFVAKSGKDLEKFSEMTQKHGEMMESYWQHMHLPSTQDMREIYQKLYTIERKLDELDKRMRTADKAPSATAKKSK